MYPSKLKMRNTGDCSGKEVVQHRITQLERHLETDEVFVLLEGGAVLFLGQCNDPIVDISCQQMKSGKLYIVKKNGWHSCV